VKDNWDTEGSVYTWFCESDKEYTYIYANFHEADPNKELVEINVRKSCFYPDSTGINFITVKGFHMNQAATQWAPPTAEQIGLIGTNWSKGWIIENNIVSDSKCSGITLGKYGDEFDNTSANSAEGYIETVKRALERGWSKENIGSHIIRNNTIFSCEQTGICGSMGGRLNMSPHSRVTPYHLPHSTEIAGYHELLGGDNRFINNIFLKGCELNIDQDNSELKTRLHYGMEDFGLSAYNKSALPVVASCNAYLNGALPFEKEDGYLELPFSPKLEIEENEKGIILSFDFDEKLVKMKNRVVRTELLGETIISKQAFVNRDNSTLIIDADYSGAKRDGSNPMVGPFEIKGKGVMKIKVW
jgi:hypothetical protein